MGSSSSIVVQEFNENEQENPVENWITKDKNADYWFSKKRLTKISRKNYKGDYIRGFFYGYTDRENSIDLEKEF
jgi:hypothetical protein